MSVDHPEKAAEALMDVFNNKDINASFFEELEKKA
jgi:hypothetical protein